MRLPWLAFLPGVLVAQAPHLEPLPIAPMLRNLDFAVDGGFAIERSGCIALYNVDDGKLVCIDPVSGAARWAGRSGAGPTEFRQVTSMVAARSGGLVVYDAGNARFALISPDWKISNTVKHAPVLALAAAWSDSVLALTLPTAAASDLVAISLKSGEAKRRFAPSSVDSSGRFLDPAIPNGPWAKSILELRRGSWLIPAQRDYLIFVSNAQGNKQGEFGRRSLEAELPNEWEKDRIEQQFTANTRNATPEVKKAVRQIFDARLKRPKAAMIPGAIAEDASSRVWVGTTRIRADSSEVDVFNAAGGFLGTVRVPGQISRLQIRGDELFALVTFMSGARDGMQGMLRYRIR